MFASLKTVWRKPLLFGLLAALGCLAAALPGEAWLALAMPPPVPPPSPPPQIDVLFVLDVTASMQNEIDGVRDGITSFALQLGERGLDARVGLLAFRDRLIGEEP